ncbi:MAG: protoporphyrinogen oxidase, partial [Micrococcales bacterium]|nr:protoporphyrinogen oxidase [Micrococcales bacterium]
SGVHTPSGTSRRTARVVVVGAGFSGLLVARRLRLAGHGVTIVEGSSRVGGHVHTIELQGRRVDVGAEALHLALPAARQLVDDLGLGEEIVAAGSSPSWLWTPRGRRVLPAGVGPAGPTRLRPVLRSGILSLAGLARAGLEPAYARTTARLSQDPQIDISVGDFVAGRFGQEVSDAFVDPLLGSLHAGDVSRLSLRACAPSLVSAATTGRSLVRRRPAPASAAATVGKAGRAAGAAGSGPPPVVFASFPQGLSRIVDAIADGTDVRTGRSAVAIERTAHSAPDDGCGYAVRLDDGSSLPADAIVLAISAPAAARLVRAHAPAAAARLAEIPLASTATLVFAFRNADVAAVPALQGNGILVPSRFGGTIKAATHLSTKWPHLRDGSSYLVRASAGRAGNDEVDGLDDMEAVERVRADLARFVGITAEPTQVHVQRWRSGLPQLHVGHLARMGRTRTELAQALPGVVLTGASYDGVGLSSCITSATRAAADVMGHLVG